MFKRLKRLFQSEEDIHEEVLSQYRIIAKQDGIETMNLLLFWKIYLDEIVPHHLRERQFFEISILKTS